MTSCQISREKKMKDDKYDLSNEFALELEKSSPLKSSPILSRMNNNGKKEDSALKLLEMEYKQKLKEQKKQLQ